jgi:hypothetical protein
MRTNQTSVVAQRVSHLAAIVGAVLLCSCSRPLPLQVVVSPGSPVEKGQPVYVDTILAGEVVEITQEGGEKVANLVVKDKAAKELLKVGVLYLPTAGKVQINTDAVKAGAQPLPRGARIPASSALGILVLKYSNQSTLMAVGAALVVVVVLWLVFRSLVGTIGLILCTVLAGVLTQAVFFHAIPWVDKGLRHFGPPPVEAPAVTTPDAKSNAAPQAAISVPSPSDVLKKAEATIQELVTTRPSPAVVTWCLVFVGLFILLNVTLGKAARAWRS